MHQLKDLLIDPEVEVGFKKRQTLNFLKRIYTSMEKQKDILLLKNFCEDLMDSEKREAVELILRNLNYSFIEGHWLSFKKIEFKLLKLKGDIEKQNKLFISLLEYCALRKLYSKGLELLEVHGHSLFPEQYFVFQLLFMTQKGDGDTLDKKEEFHFILDRYISGVTLGFDKLDQLLESQLLSQNINLLDATTPKILYCLKVKYIINKIELKSKLGHKTLNEREQILNSLYQRIVLSPNEIVYYLLITQLGLVLKRKKLLLSIKAAALSNSEMKGSKPYLENALEHLFKKIITTKDEPIDEAELDKELLSLIGLEQNEEVQKPIKAKKGNPFVFHNISFEERKLQHLLKSCEFLHKNDVEKYFKDILASFIYLSGYQLALDFIDQYSELWVKDVAQEIERDYLKAEILLLQEKYPDAEALARECIDRHPLKEEEKINFFYVLGCAKSGQGHKSEALGIFSTIKSQRPNYRSVKWRLKEIESTQ